MKKLLLLATIALALPACTLYFSPTGRGDDDDHGGGQPDAGWYIGDAQRVDDGGYPQVDAGHCGTDASYPTYDGGYPQIDAQPRDVDGGTPYADAAISRDGGAR